MQQQQSPVQQQQPTQQQQQQIPEQSTANAAFSPQLPPLSFGDLGLQQRTPLPPVAEVSGTTTPEMRTISVDVPPITVAQPHAGAVSPPSIRSVTSQAYQKQPSMGSQAPASDGVSSPQPQPSSPTSPKGKAREGSISHGSLPSPRQRGHPIAPSTSQSTSDDRPPSRTSIPTSPDSVVETVSPFETAFTGSKKHASDNMSILSSPYSPGSIRRELPPICAPPDRALPTEPSGDAGALYYVNTIEGDASKRPASRVPTTISEQNDSSSSESDQQATVANLSSPATSPPPTSVGPSSPRISEIPKFVPTVPAGVNRKNPTVRSGSGRKPSGARELGTGRSFNNGSLSSSPKPLAKEGSDSDDSMDVSQLPSRAKKVPPPDDDSNLDVLAALSYLNANGEPPSPPVGKPVEPLKIRSPERAPPPESSSPPSAPVPAPNEPMHDTQYRSSFAPSKQAVERKAKVQAQQVAHHAAVHKPGRLNGRRKSKMGGAWGESSEEEEEEEEEDDEADSDDGAPSANKPFRPPSGNASSNTSSKPPQSQNPSLHYSDAVGEQGGQSGLRGPRILPQPPHGIIFFETPNGLARLTTCNR